MAADGREHALQPRPRIRRAAYHLQALGAGVDLADLELVGVGMLLAFEHLRHAERGERGGRIEHLLHLEPNAGERVGDLRDRRRRVEMFLEPGEREFHVLMSSVPQPTSARRAGQSHNA